MKINSNLRMMVAALMLLGFASESSAIQLTGWNTVGSVGTSGSDGVVMLSPFGDPEYGWVSTNGGIDGVALPGVGGAGAGTNGSVATSTLFASGAGAELNFFFNYVTSDGAGFADYAWARLLDSASNEVALLFTARTVTGGGSTVPGFSMPAPAATLTPSSTAIIPGAPTWSPLGASSETCFNTGCGYTGWIAASYTIAAAGNYFLEFGVTNWNDELYQSGMAFDGATIGGAVIDDVAVGVPEPAVLVLLSLGFIGLFSSSYRRRH